MIIKHTIEIVVDKCSIVSSPGGTSPDMILFVAVAELVGLGDDS